MAARPPAVAPSAVSAPQPVDPTLGGLIPAGYPDPGAYVQRLEAVAGSGRVLPDQLKVLQGRIEAIHKALEPTPDMKNARAAGMPMKDFLDRSDTANTDRAVLTNSILPKLDKSQDTATAARDEILAIHRSREQSTRLVAFSRGRRRLERMTNLMSRNLEARIAKLEQWRLPRPPYVVRVNFPMDGRGSRSRRKCPRPCCRSPVQVRDGRGMIGTISRGGCCDDSTQHFQPR